MENPRLLFRCDKVASAPAAWAKAYAKTRDERQIKITQRLAALNPPTKESVDAIIGNPSWTRLYCDQCGIDAEVLVRIGEEPDYESRWIDLCGSCVALASQLCPLNRS